SSSFLAHQGQHLPQPCVIQLPDVPISQLQVLGTNKAGKILILVRPARPATAASALQGLRHGGGLLNSGRFNAMLYRAQIYHQDDQLLICEVTFHAPKGETALPRSGWVLKHY